MGMLLRLILLGIVIWAVFRLVQRLLPASASQNGNTASPASGNQIMRRCAWCNVHIPEGESTQSRGEFFCSEAHRDAFLREPRR